MIEKILSWFLSGSSIGLYVICVAVGAFGGWYVTSDHYQAEIEKIQNALQAQATKEINDYAKRLADVTDDLQRANDRIADISGRNSDLARRLLDANNRESKRAEAYSSDALRAKYSECRKLLSEGGGLLQEGRELVGRVAVEKDALAKLAR